MVLLKNLPNFLKIKRRVWKSQILKSKMILRFQLKKDSEKWWKKSSKEYFLWILKKMISKHILMFNLKLIPSWMKLWVKFFLLRIISKPSSIKFKMQKWKLEDPTNLDQDLESQERENQLMIKELKNLNKMVTKVCFLNNIFEISLMPLRFSLSEAHFRVL